MFESVRIRVVRLFSLLAFVVIAHAQEPMAPTASPSPARTVMLRFAPPPMEGTISLGIYDAKGKLVRVLHREDAFSDFTAGHDALETTWDGNDDRGTALPSGKYSARGYLVGNLKVEGIDYFFNDWVTDEKSPHILNLSHLSTAAGELHLIAELAGRKVREFICDQTTGVIQRELSSPIEPRYCEESPDHKSLLSPFDCAAGGNQTIWFIDALDRSGSREVKQLAANHDLLRRLAYSQNDPQPQSIAASETEDKIFLIEKSERLQRVRALTLIRTISNSLEGSISDWKTDFEKKIVAHKNFSIENGKPVANPPNEQIVPEKIKQKLQPNPLKRDQPDKVELSVGIDSDGSCLKTADGLPLRTISETPNLSRAVMTAHGDKAVDIFEDDGAVVEQFRISGLDQMMAFDCGAFDLK
jgi:hypothetical protein